MSVPFVDLYAQYLTIKSEIDEAIGTVIRETAFISGKYAAQFEQAFAAYTGQKYCIACGNGTDSIEMLLQAMGIGVGDEVIVPAISWISTSEAVSAIGATPVFVDIDPEYYTLNPALIEAAITPRTKAIIPVHLYGQAADMPAIMAIASRHNLRVLEDCAQAHGAMVGGKMVGTFGDCASFSFYPGKNLGAYGDAGGMTTNSEEIATTARMIANHGQQGKHNHLREGRNSRLDGLQGAILGVKLPYLEQWTAARIAHAARYTELLTGATHLALPATRPDSRHVFHLYVIRTADRKALQARLHEVGIETAVHYPTALPFLKCYEHRGFTPAQFPVAAQYQHEILSIPMFAELTEGQIQTVIAALKA